MSIKPILKKEEYEIKFSENYEHDMQFCFIIQYEYIQWNTRESSMVFN